jgi:hypothetical protein
MPFSHWLILKSRAGHRLLAPIFNRYRHVVGVSFEEVSIYAADVSVRSAKNKTASRNK